MKSRIYFVKYDIRLWKDIPVISLNSFIKIKEELFDFGTELDIGEEFEKKIKNKYGNQATYLKITSITVI